MKKLFIILAVFAMQVFAGECERMYQRLVDAIQGQTVTICRVANVEKNRTDVIGMFFNMHGQDVVLLYGVSYDTMLYPMNDSFVKNATCMQDKRFRTIKREMSDEEIAEKLMSFKDCEEDYYRKHNPRNTKNWLYTN